MEPIRLNTLFGAVFHGPETRTESSPRRSRSLSAFDAELERMLDGLETAKSSDSICYLPAGSSGCAELTNLEPPEPVFAHHDEPVVTYAMAAHLLAAPADGRMPSPGGLPLPLPLDGRLAEMPQHPEFHVPAFVPRRPRSERPRLRKPMVPKRRVRAKVNDSAAGSPPVPVVQSSQLAEAMARTHDEILLQDAMHGGALVPEVTLRQIEAGIGILDSDSARKANLLTKMYFAQEISLNPQQIERLIRASMTCATRALRLTTDDFANLRAFGQACVSDAQLRPTPLTEEFGETLTRVVGVSVVGDPSVELLRLAFQGVSKNIFRSTAFRNDVIRKSLETLPLCSNSLHRLELAENVHTLIGGPPNSIPYSGRKAYERAITKLCSDENLPLDTRARIAERFIEYVNGKSFSPNLVSVKAVGSMLLRDGNQRVESLLGPGEMRLRGLEYIVERAIALTERRIAAGRRAQKSAPTA